MAANGGALTPGNVPVVVGEDSFLDRQKKRFKEIEKKYEEDAKKRKREWEKDVERMRKEFLKLYPADRTVEGDDASDEPLISRRKGSIDVLDVRKFKTLFAESPIHGYKFRLRFDLREDTYDLDTLKLFMQDNVICVRAMKSETQEDGETIHKEYYRKIEKPADVDLDKLKCCMSKDRVLLVESVMPPHTLNLLRSTSSKLSHSSPAHTPQKVPTSHSSHSHSPSGSPNTPISTASMAMSKPGLVIFGGPANERRMNLVVEIGKYWKPKEITCQIVNSMKIEINAKHEKKTVERFAKHKFCREWELNEKIEAYSIRAGLTDDGKLIVGALCKDHDLVKNGPHGKELWDELCAEGAPCNVLDLADMPPSTPVAP